MNSIWRGTPAQKAAIKKAAEASAAKRRVAAKNSHDDPGYSAMQSANMAKMREEANRRAAEHRKNNPDLYGPEPSKPAPAKAPMPTAASNAAHAARKPARDQHPLKSYYDQTQHTPEQQRNLDALRREADRRQAAFKKKNRAAYDFIPD